MDSLESKMLVKKPWYLHGEASAKDRPENALLEEHFEVQRHAIYSNDNSVLPFVKNLLRLMKIYLSSS